VSFNKVIVVGNLGRDPELRYTPQGTPVCSFSVASNERRKGSDGEFQDITTWFRVTSWGKQAETVSKYLTKGRSVYVEGRLRVEEWTDKDGKSRYTLELHATDVQFIDGAGGGQGGGGGRDYERGGGGGGGGGRDTARGGGGSPADDPGGDDDDSIPF
jgi:single-strand DNA-binding protein